MKWFIVFMALSVLTTATTAQADHCKSALGPLLQSASKEDGTEIKRYQSAIVIGDVRLDTCNELPDPFPTSLAVHKDSIYVGFREKGLLKWDDDKFVALMKPSLPVRRLEVAGGSLWIGTPHGLWQLQNDDKLTRAKHRRLSKAAISELMVDPNGALHVARTPRGWWTLKEGKFRKMSNKTVGCFAVAKNGKVQTKDRSHCTQHQAPLHATSLAKVGDTVFAGTLSEGLYQRKGRRWKHIDGSPKFINVLLKDGENLLIGSPHGVFQRTASGAFSKIKIAKRSVHVNGLHRDASGTLWVAGSEALYAKKGATIRRFDQRNGLPGRIVFAVTSTPDGSTWAATSEGVVRLNSAGNTVFSHELGTLPDNWVTSLLADGDKVIAGTYDAGVVTLDGSGVSQPIKALKKLWVNPNGLARTGDTLYINTLGDGLVRYTRHKASKVVSLPSTDVTAVLKSGSALWVATRSGIVRR